MAIPEDLVKGIRERRCVLFAGAGLSCTAGLPNWRELLKLLIDKAQTLGLGTCRELHRELRAGNLGIVADEVKDLLGPNHFRTAIQEHLQPCGTAAAGTHSLLKVIPFFAAYTTNYDNLIESAYTAAGNCVSPHVYTHDNYAGLANAFHLGHLGQFYVVKAHGDIDRDETIVFGPSDYRRLLRHNDAYHGHLLSLLSTKLVLFLGYSLTDPDMSFFLEELTATYRGHLRSHYALFESSTMRPLLKKHFARSYGIEVVPWRGTGAGIPDIHNFISELNDVVRHGTGAPPRTPQTP